MAVINFFKPVVGYEAFCTSDATCMSQCQVQCAGGCAGEDESRGAVSVASVQQRGVPRLHLTSPFLSTLHFVVPQALCCIAKGCKYASLRWDQNVRWPARRSPARHGRTALPSRSRKPAPLQGHGCAPRPATQTYSSLPPILLQYKDYGVYIDQTQRWSCWLYSDGQPASSVSTGTCTKNPSRHAHRPAAATKGPLSATCATGTQWAAAAAAAQCRKEGGASLQEHCLTRARPRTSLAAPAAPRCGPNIGAWMPSFTTTCFLFRTVRMEETLGSVQRAGRAGRHLPPPPPTRNHARAPLPQWPPAPSRPCPKSCRCPSQRPLWSRTWPHTSWTAPRFSRRQARESLHPGGGMSVSAWCMRERAAVAARACLRGSGSAPPYPGSPPRRPPLPALAAGRHVEDWHLQHNLFRVGGALPDLRLAKERSSSRAVQLSRHGEEGHCPGADGVALRFDEMWPIEIPRETGLWHERRMQRRIAGSHGGRMVEGHHKALRNMGRLLQRREHRGAMCLPHRVSLPAAHRCCNNAFYCHVGLRWRGGYLTADQCRLIRLPAIPCNAMCSW